eukprot:CAMPEP_0172444652 /NCGR_PEP_ID=MMETSP1065-20121228/4676_1 /TAXON_ID=265537 /ORGANISM="Amphiprora paludosa, Strain CCMP125" /LENGTH=159 /DNA_ID=CAMNT_0013195275 /DNA_START=215 /DNA_END=693 /DNA_ORIENTATION=+
MAPSKANDSFDESPPPGLRRVSDGSIQQQSDEEEGDMHSMLCDLQLPKSSRNTNMEKRLLLLSVFVGLMIMGCLLRIWLYQEDDPVPLDIVTVSSDSPRVGLKNLPLRAHDVKLSESSYSSPLADTQSIHHSRLSSTMLVRAHVRNDAFAAKAREKYAV